MASPHDISSHGDWSGDDPLTLQPVFPAEVVAGLAADLAIVGEGEDEWSFRSRDDRETLHLDQLPLGADKLLGSDRLRGRACADHSDVGLAGAGAWLRPLC